MKVRELCCTIIYHLRWVGFHQVQHMYHNANSGMAESYMIIITEFNFSYIWMLGHYQLSNFLDNQIYKKKIIYELNNNSIRSFSGRYSLNPLSKLICCIQYLVMLSWRQWMMVSLGIAPRMLQLPRIPQLKLSTWGSYKLRGDNAICIIDWILLMPPSVMKLYQCAKIPFLLLNYSESLLMKV